MPCFGIASADIWEDRRGNSTKCCTVAFCGSDNIVNGPVAILNYLCGSHSDQVHALSTLWLCISVFHAYARDLIEGFDWLTLAGCLWRSISSQGIFIWRIQSEIMNLRVLPRTLICNTRVVICNVYNNGG